MSRSVWVEFDPNVRIDGGSFSSLEDVHGGDIAVGEVVTLREPEAGIETTGEVLDIDREAGIVCFSVDWKGLHRIPNPAACVSVA